MKRERFVIMGAGEVGFHVARTLGRHGHDIVLIDRDPEKRSRIEDELDLRFVVGRGTQVPVLKDAGVKGCELFIAVSNSEEANLASALLAKDLGARRCVVRLETPEELSTYRSLYERLFRADLLLSPQSLATTQILNWVLGHNTHEIDFLARGKIQLRTIEVQPGCPLTRGILRDLAMPGGSRIVGYLGNEQELTIPSPDQRAEAGAQAIVLCTDDSIRAVERLFASQIVLPDFVVVGGGGLLGAAIAESLVGTVRHVVLIEHNRKLAERVAAGNPQADVIHGDATDVDLLRSIRVHQADSFIAALGHDEANLMSCLVAQELGVAQVITAVGRTETSSLWAKAGTFHVVSPRYLAAQRILDFVRNGYKANMISLQGGALHVVTAEIFAASPVVGATLAELNPPHGLIVGALVRGEEVTLPVPTSKFAAGDQVLLFVHNSELPTVQLFFPGSEVA